MHNVKKWQNKQREKISNAAVRLKLMKEWVGETQWWEKFIILDTVEVQNSAPTMKSARKVNTYDYGTIDRSMTPAQKFLHLV